MKENSSENKAPRTVIDRLRFIGPSAIVTGSVVGSGSIVMTPLLGAAAGFTFMVVTFKHMDQANYSS